MGAIFGLLVVLLLAKAFTEIGASWQSNGLNRKAFNVVIQSAKIQKEFSVLADNEDEARVLATKLFRGQHAYANIIAINCNKG